MKHKKWVMIVRGNRATVWFAPKYCGLTVVNIRTEKGVAVTSCQYKQRFLSAAKLVNRMFNFY